MNYFLKSLRLVTLLFLLLSYQNSVAENSCRRIFSEVTFAEAREIIQLSLAMNTFNQISISEIKQLESFGPGHPQRSHGYSSSEMLKGQLGRKTILVKKAKMFEIRMAFAMSRLGVGPRFHGITGNGEYYIIDFISDGMLIKANNIDQRYQQLQENGFELKEKSFQQISLILKSLAQLSLEARDPQFIIKRSGEVFLIDPEFFILTDVPAATKFATQSEADFLNLLTNLRNLK